MAGKGFVDTARTHNLLVVVGVRTRNPTGVTIELDLERFPNFEGCLAFRQTFLAATWECLHC